MQGRNQRAGTGRFAIDFDKMKVAGEKLAGDIARNVFKTNKKKDGHQAILFSCSAIKA